MSSPTSRAPTRAPAGGGHGGGGGGGIVDATNIDLSGNVLYEYTIGDGGAGVDFSDTNDFPNWDTNYGKAGNNGEDTSFCDPANADNKLVANGGGGGGGGKDPGTHGGSGGGSGYFSYFDSAAADGISLLEDTGLDHTSTTSNIYHNTNDIQLNGDNIEISNNNTDGWVDIASCGIHVGYFHMNIVSDVSLSFVGNKTEGNLGLLLNGGTGTLIQQNNTGATNTIKTDDGESSQISIDFTDSTYQSDGATVLDPESRNPNTSQNNTDDFGIVYWSGSLILRYETNDLSGIDIYSYDGSTHTYRGHLSFYNVIKVETPRSYIDGTGLLIQNDYYMTHIAQDFYDNMDNSAVSTVARGDDLSGNNGSSWNGVSFNQTGSEGQAWSSSYAGTSWGRFHRFRYHIAGGGGGSSTSSIFGTVSYGNGSHGTGGWGYSNKYLNNATDVYGGGAGGYTIANYLFTTMYPASNFTPTGSVGGQGHAGNVIGYTHSADGAANRGGGGAPRNETATLSGAGGSGTIIMRFKVNPYVRSTSTTLDNSLDHYSEINLGATYAYNDLQAIYVVSPNEDELSLAGCAIELRNSDKELVATTRVMSRVKSNVASSGNTYAINYIFEGPSAEYIDADSYTSSDLSYDFYSDSASPSINARGIGVIASNIRDIYYELGLSDSSYSDYISQSSLIKDKSTLSIEAKSVIQAHKMLYVGGTAEFENNVGIGRLPSEHALDVSGSLHCTSLFINGLDYDLSYVWNTDTEGNLTTQAHVGIGLDAAGFHELDVSGTIMANQIHIVNSRVSGTTDVVEQYRTGLSVENDVSFGSHLQVIGDVSLESDLEISGAVTLHNTLDVSNAATFRDDVMIHGDLEISGGAVTLHDTLDVSNSATFHDSVSILGGLDISGGVTLTGHIIPSQHNTYSLGSPGSRFKEGYFGASTLYIGNTQLGAGADGLEFDDVSMSGKLNVGGITTLKSTLCVKEDVSMEQNLDVSGAVTLQDTLDVSNAVTFQSSLYVNGDVSFIGNLIIGGHITPNFDSSYISISGDVSMGGNIIPAVDSIYDIGSAEYKIRHLYLSNNSLWLGDDNKLSVDETTGSFKSRKRKTGVIPKKLLELIPPITLSHLTAWNSSVTQISQMTLKYWDKFVKESARRPDIAAAGIYNSGDLYDNNDDDDFDDDTTWLKHDATGDISYGGGNVFVDQSLHVVGDVSMGGNIIMSGGTINNNVTYDVSVNSGMMFTINGVDAPELTLMRGFIYNFDQTSSATYSSHPIGFTTEDTDGNSTTYNSVSYTSGVSISGDVTTFIVPQDAPDQLYYECQNHPNMGNAINIVHLAQAGSSGSESGGLWTQHDTGDISYGDGNVFIDAGLNVSSAVTLQDTLEVSNAATFNSSLRVVGAVTMEGGLDVTGYLKVPFGSSTGSSATYEGYIRYNDVNNEFQGYDAIDNAWSSLGLGSSTGTNSDDRLKHNEQDISGLELITQLKPQKYLKTRMMYEENYTLTVDDSGNYTNLLEGDIVSEEMGIIAQDILKIPELNFCVVNTTPYSLKYDNLFVLSIQAIKELKAKNDALQTSHDALKALLQSKGLLD